MKVLAVDPDKDKSGFALLDGRELVSVGCLSFCELQTLIETTEAAGEVQRIYVEAGWLETANWHVRRGDSPQKAAAIGRSVGMNHQTGMLLVQWCEHMGYDVEAVHPLRKCWRGRDGKITGDELRQTTGLQLPNRMNQDARDAVLLAWVMSGNPLRVPVRRRK